jgi:hypothetical protein
MIADLIPGLRSKNTPLMQPAIAYPRASGGWARALRIDAARGLGGVGGRADRGEEREVECHSRTS